MRRNQPGTALWVLALRGTAHSTTVHVDVALRDMRRATGAPFACGLNAVRSITRSC